MVGKTHSLDLGTPTACSLQDPEFLRRISKISKCVNIDSMKAVIDVGCGLGQYTIFTGTRAKLAIGIDIQRRLLRRAKEVNRLPNVFYISMSAHAIGFAL